MPHLTLLGHDLLQHFIPDFVFGTPKKRLESGIIKVRAFTTTNISKRPMQGTLPDWFFLRTLYLTG
jgi:hypothetical protein